MSGTHHRVVAAILLRRGHVLLCHRRADRAWYPAVWDLPGGHVKRGETLQEALARECREELGVEIIDLGDAVEATSRDVTLTVYIVRSWVGEPVNRAPSEHQEIGWFTAASLVGLPLANERLGWFLHDVLGSW